MTLTSDYCSGVLLIGGTHSCQMISWEITFVFRFNGHLINLDHAPHSLVHFRADQDFTPGGSSAITRCLIYYISDHCKFHPIRSAHKTMHHFSAMNSNPKLGTR